MSNVFKAKPKPIEFDAIQFTGGKKSAHEVGWFILQRNGSSGIVSFYPGMTHTEFISGHAISRGSEDRVEVQGHQRGNWTVNLNYWVIAKDPESGNFIVVSDEKFEETYCV